MIQEIEEEVHVEIKEAIDIEIKEEIENRVTKVINGKVEDLKGECIDYLRVIKFNCIAINPLLKFIYAKKSRVERIILSSFMKALMYLNDLFL